MLTTPFNDSWYLTTETPSSPSTKIGPLSVPYDAMIREPRNPTMPHGGHTGYYPGGVYRYSKTLFAPSEWAQLGAVTLQFEGVYHRSKVYVNGTLAGGRPNGYTLFHVEMKDFLKFGEENSIEVIADTTDQPNSRWYTGSGIYRPVQLLLGGEVRIPPFGVRVTTLEVKEGEAVVEVGAKVVGAEGLGEGYEVEIKLTSLTGELVAPAVKIPLASSVTQKITIPSPKTWSPDSPTLHTITVTLLSPTSIPLDTYTDTFGIRTLTWSYKTGLLINSQRTLLRGACVHHDNGVIGANTLEVAEERRVRILKENGYNSIRASHNPMSLAMLRACDKYGVMVMDELCDIWLVAKTEHDYTKDFLEWWERDFESLVEKDYNHPSVVMYSIGNEIAETSLPSGIAQSAIMVKRIKELDSTRPLTNSINGMISANTLDPMMAINKLIALGVDVSKVTAPAETEASKIEQMNFFISCWEDYMPELTTEPAVDEATREAWSHVDVAGGNYVTDRVEMDITGYPERMYVGSETGMDIWKAWALVEKYPQVIGDFIWTGWDYIGEAGLSAPTYDVPRALHQPYPAQLAGAACIDITGFPQGQVFLSKVVWGLTNNNPIISVHPVQMHGKLFRQGLWRKTDSFRSWNWRGFEGKGASVEVYCAAPQVRLELNGKVVGTKTTGVDAQYLAEFETTYEQGELVAIALDAEGKEIGRDVISSGSGKGVKLSVKPEVESLLNDGQDAAFIPIEITDSEGVVLPLEDKKVKVVVTGAGELLGLGSGNPTTPEGYVSAEATTYYGRALAVVRAGLKEGKVTVTVSAEGCEDVTVELAVGGQ